MSPKQVGPEKNHTMHIIIKMPKVKDKEGILKVAREKQLVIYRGVPIRLSADFSKKLYRLEETGKKYSKGSKARTYIVDDSIQQSYHLEWKGR